MPRTVDHHYRDAIAEQAAVHLLEHGRIDVSLRELAAAVDVSPRMLVHHFGSREELVSRALREARSRQRAAFEGRLAAQPGRPYADVLTDAWRWFMSDEAQPYMRLFGQLYAVAGTPGSPHAEFLRESVMDWLPTLEAGFAADDVAPDAARELATLTVGVIRGLLQDAGATGDHERVSAGFNRYASLLPASYPDRRAWRTPPSRRGGAA